MRKITYSKSVYPNFATGLNVLSGFVSIVLASQNNFKLAALFIFIAAFFDLLDGIIARILRTSSRLGVELDSLADVISFGAAPSFLIYQAFFLEYELWGILISSLPLLFGAYRLARFNVQLEDILTKIDFKGLPIPVSAVMIASLVLFYHNGLNIVEPFNSLVIPLILLLSFLMVSSIRYNTLPKIKYLKLSGRILLIGSALVALLVVVLTKGTAFFYLITLHIFFGILRHIYNFIFNRSNGSGVKLNQKISKG